ncbi:MAG TPA: ABC transporter ATP-binding protein, partial [Acidimicrobiales bacterium]|nr:ABC transporter ATP-binding protein [Acidimicrobiales bacterium]
MAAIVFEHVTKRFTGGAAKESLRETLGRAVRRDRTPRGTLALDDVSFTVEPGQSVALIGPNGAGKTTSLKVASRITYPTSGRVRVRGRLAALIEVGAGVHPELTGRENIWLYGRILGMDRTEIARRFDEIVAFSELERALDMPVKMYSSGMQLRLGFSIAAHLEPEIFVVDEALAVGDAGFQAKCVERMSSLVAEGRTLLFVSHHLQSVEALCDTAVFFVDGRVQADGPAREVLGEYVTWSEDRRRRVLDGSSEPGSGGLRIARAAVHDLDGNERDDFAEGEGLELRLGFEGDTPIRSPHVNIGITDGRTGIIVQLSMLHDGQAPEVVGTSWECRCRV